MVSRVGSLGWWRLQRLLRFWSIHTPVVLIVRGTPQTCLETLATASRPSTQRLHLRNLFTSGRRYEIAQRTSGFLLRTTNKVSWHYRRRTTSAAIMKGLFSPVGEELTRVQLSARISLNCLINTLIFPSGLAFLIGSVPWPPLLLASLIGLVYGLSWVGNRANAVLEVNEMVFFVQTALEDLGMAELPTLSANGASENVIRTQREFSREWEKFYREHVDDGD